jgi:putative endonuclease
MTDRNQRLGKWGEAIAAQYLAAHGFEILARNLRTPYGEIDVLARREDVTIFLEVKTLRSSRNFYPEHNITARKREHMRAAAEFYAAEHNIDHWQIDVIAIEGRPARKPAIRYFENALQ